MASVELLKITQGVDDKVKGVDDRVKVVEKRVQDVSGDVQGIGDKIQAVDDKVQVVGSNVQDIIHSTHDDSEIKGASDKRSSSSNIRALHLEGSGIFTGDRLRDSLLRWLSPPDTSTNHNMARKVHHRGTTQWFLQGNVFNEWKTSDSVLWIHGKRGFFLVSSLK
jgi:hypothetical protein